MYEFRTILDIKAFYIVYRQENTIDFYALSRFILFVYNNSRETEIGVK